MLWTLVFLSTALAAIESDFNCTTYTTEFVWAPSATTCSNVLSDAACSVLYVGDSGVYPAPGANTLRTAACYTLGADGDPIDAGMKKVAIENCPKHCGYCCQTTAYNCKNVQFPRLKCETITAAQCLSATWRTIIAADCPNACGFCNEGGCVDGVLDCANDISICNAVGMQDFVNQYCQKTCQRCASSTTAASAATTCTSYIPNSSTACASWAANGFCTNTFYTVAQRRAYCATTCRLC